MYTFTQQMTINTFGLFYSAKNTGKKMYHSFHKNIRNLNCF